MELAKEYTMAEALTPEVSEQAQTAAEPQRAAAPAKEVKRQTIGFTFFKVLPEWRRLWLPTKAGTGQCGPGTRRTA